MVSAVRIERFRRFEAYRLENLGRVNLIMGANNCGKTTVLEAVHLLTSHASKEAVTQALWRRDGTVTPFLRMSGSNSNTNVAPLFFGNACEADATFRITSSGSASEAYVSGRISDRLREWPEEDQNIDSEDLDMELRIEGDPEPLVKSIPLNSRGDTTKNALNWSTRKLRKNLHETPKSIALKPTGLDALDLVFMWNDVVLTPDEERILKVLGTLDDGIDRIAAQIPSGVQQGIGPRHAGFVVRHKNVPNLLPMESLGSGVWRLFSIALAVIQCRQGTLLVDEIDIGLYPTAQSIMWRMILSLARELDVQVFATTHDLDCVNRLAEAALGLGDADEAPSVVFHRIEEGKQEPVQYSPSEIRISLEWSLEVR